MFIQVIPNRGSPPAILLRESYREGGKVKKRTLCNLTHWPASLREGFKALLKGGTVISAPAAPEVFTIRRALPHGHVAAVLGTLRQIGLDRILGPDGNESMQNRGVITPLLLLPCGHHSQAGSPDSVDERRPRACRSARLSGRRGRVA